MVFDTPKKTKLVTRVNDVLDHGLPRRKSPSVDYASVVKGRKSLVKGYCDSNTSRGLIYTLLKALGATIN